MKTRIELKADAERLATEYNDLKQSNAPVADCNKKSDELDECVKQCNSVAMAECFKAICAEPDPMLAAVRRLTYDGIKAVEDKTEGVTTTVTRIDDIARPIDLNKLLKYAKGNLGKDTKWPHMVQRFNMLMTARVIVDVNGGSPATVLKSVNDSMAMSDIARAFELGETPTSNTKMLAELNKVIAAMIGPEYKAVSHDVAYIDRIFAKKGKGALKLQCATHRHMTGYLAEVCHRIVTGKKYDVDYKKVK